MTMQLHAAVGQAPRCMREATVHGKTQPVPWGSASKLSPGQNSPISPLPRGSSVVLFRLWLVLFLGIIIYCPRRNYIGAFG